MKFTTTIFLLVTLIIAGLIFAFVRSVEPEYERERRLSGQSQEAGQPLFSPDEFSPDDIQSVTIQREGQKIILEKEGEDWWQIEPVRFALNSWEVKNIPDDTSKLRYLEKLRSGQDETISAQKLGLAPTPRAVITLVPARGKGSPQKIKLGRKSLGGVGYLMINEDPGIYVVKSELHKRVLDKEISEWRKTSIDSAKEGQADHVKLVQGGRTIELAKSNGTWALESPNSGRVSRKEVEQLLNDIDGFYINKFVKDQPEDLSVYGLAESETTVTIRKPAPPPPSEPTTQAATDGQPDEEPDSTGETPPPTVYTLRIGSPVDLKKEHFFATWSEGEHGGDVVFQLAKSSVEKLDKTVDDMRDARITPLEDADVRQIKVSTPEHGDVHLLHEEARWQFEPSSAPGFAADDGETSKLVTAIASAEADAYMANASPADEPVATITLGAVARTQSDVLRVFAQGEGEKHLVLRNNETTGYVVDGDRLEGCLKPALNLRDRLVLDAADDQIHRVTITRADGTRSVFERDLPPVKEEAEAEAASPDPASTTQPAAMATTQTATAAAEVEAASKPGPWRFVGHERFEASALQDLVKEFLPLRATSWMVDAAGLAPGATRVEIQGATAAPIVLTANLDSRVATLTGVDRPFEISEILANAINAELRYRTVLSFNTTDIRRVTVGRDGQTQVIGKDGDDYVGDGEGKIDQSAAGGLFDTLAGLRVERYLPDGHVVEVTTTITVELDDEQTHVLEVAESKGGGGVVAINSQAYVLSESVYEKLTADLFKQDDDKEE